MDWLGTILINSKRYYLIILNDVYRTYKCTKEACPAIIHIKIQTFEYGLEKARSVHTCQFNRTLVANHREDLDLPINWIEREGKFEQMKKSKIIEFKDYLMSLVRSSLESVP